MPFVLGVVHRHKAIKVVAVRIFAPPGIKQVIDVLLHVGQSSRWAYRIARQKERALWRKAGLEYPFRERRC